MYVLGAILALGLLIIVHEAGHFFVGRWCGMRIERFSIGFGPGLVKWRSKKGTLFQLAPVPFGGFVEIKGMNIAEDVDPDDKQAYPNRPVWQRIATDLKPRLLDRIARRTIPFEELPLAFPAYMEGQVIGRTVVKISAQP